MPPMASPAAACPPSHSQQHWRLAISLRLLAAERQQKAGAMSPDKMLEIEVIMMETADHPAALTSALVLLC